MERRTVQSKADLKTRSDDESGKHLRGYFAVFDQPYEMWPDVIESIGRQAFDGQTDKDVRALIDHDTAKVLGRTSAGTLKLQVDEVGLYGDVLINESDTDAMNLYSRVERGDVSQCSFGFEITDEEVEHRTDGTTHYTITGVNLYEVSVCTFPAYTGTRVDARNKESKASKKRRLDALKKQLRQRLRGESNGTKDTAAT